MSNGPCSLGFTRDTAQSSPLLNQQFSDKALVKLKGETRFIDQNKKKPILLYEIYTIIFIRAS